MKNLSPNACLCQQNFRLPKEKNICSVRAAGRKSLTVCPKRLNFEFMKKNSPANLIFLRDVEIFQDLTEAEIDALGEKMPLKNYAAKTVFYTPQDDGEVLFMIKRGRVRLFRPSADGKTFTTAILEAGTFFGKMALLGKRLYGN